MKNKQRIRENAQVEALGFYLSEYPDNMTFGEICLYLVQEEWGYDQVRPLEGYNNCGGRFIAQQMEKMVVVLMRMSQVAITCNNQGYLTNGKKYDTIYCLS